MFSNEMVWVTGSSTGIGRAIALGFAEEGYRVVVRYNSSEHKAQEVAGLFHTGEGEAWELGPS